MCISAASRQYPFTVVQHLLQRILVSCIVNAIVHMTHLDKPCHKQGIHVMGDRCGCQIQMLCQLAPVRLLVTDIGKDRKSALVSQEL